MLIDDRLAVNVTVTLDIYWNRFDMNLGQLLDYMEYKSL